MPYYTYIEKETCIACGVCGATVPELFDYDEEGVAYASRDNNKGVEKIAEHLEEDLLDAEEACPTESVKVIKK